MIFHDCSRSQDPSCQGPAQRSRLCPRAALYTTSFLPSSLCPCPFCIHHVRSCCTPKQLPFCRPGGRAVGKKQETSWSPLGGSGQPGTAGPSFHAVGARTSMQVLGFLSTVQLVGLHSLSLAAPLTTAYSIQRAQSAPHKLPCMYFTPPRLHLPDLEY